MISKIILVLQVVILAVFMFTGFRDYRERVKFKNWYYELYNSFATDVSNLNVKDKHATAKKYFPATYNKVYPLGEPQQYK